MVMEVDESRWPLVEVRWRGRASDADVDRFLAHLDGWLSRSVPFGLLLDSRSSHALVTEQRRKVLDHMRRNAARTGWLLTQAFVFDSPLQHAVYLATSWAFIVSFRSKAFRDVDAARAWLEHELQGKPRAAVS